MKLSDKDSARIVEVFSSIQGEGLTLGQRQVFVRLGGCNLECDYCDEPDTIPIPSGEVWTRAKVQAEIDRRLKERPHDAVSWTGGEPLLHPAFLTALMPWVRERGVKNYLETNGTRVEALRKVAPLCDVIAMDVKLPSAVGRDCWSEHLECLRVAPDKTFAKVVLTSKSTEAEWRNVIRLLQEVSPNIPLVLQPATRRPGTEPISPELALKFLRQASALLWDVRLIPQWHPIWQIA